MGENGLFGPLGNDLVWDLNSKDGLKTGCYFHTYSPYGQVCIRTYICMYYTGLHGDAKPCYGHFFRYILAK